MAAFLFLFRLSQPDKSQTSVYLNCMESDQGGWTFFTETGEAEPVFGFGGYMDGVFAEGSGPVAAERVLSSYGEQKFLQFSCYDLGIQVFLDGKLLYTDFPESDNRVGEFLKNVDPTGIAYDGLRIPLPDSYEGKTLRIVTYTSSADGLRPVVFPSLTGRFSDAVIQTSGVVWPMAKVTAHLLLGICLALILIFGAQEGELLWKLLPLGGYFLLASLSDIHYTYLESAAGLSTDLGLLNWLYLIQIDLLYSYLAFRLRGLKRWLLFSGALLHILLCALQSLAGVSLLSGTGTDWLGFALLILALILSLCSKEQIPQRISLSLLTVIAALFLIWGITRYTGIGIFYPLTNPVTSLVQGYPHAFYALLCGIGSLLCAIQAVMEFIRNVMLRQRELQAMKLSSQMIQGKYEDAKENLRQTALFRHEWKNHVAALSILAQGKDSEGIQAYLNRLDGELEQLSPKIYTANPTVNTILQRFAAQAEKKEITFRIQAMLPEILEVDEEDLCGFLFNLLDNAMTAASQTEQGEIFCSLQIRQQYLTIRCENTYNGKLCTDPMGQLLTTKPNASNHGFGLKKMRSIAEKYHSVLDISYDENRFTVMTALKLKQKKN